MEKRNRADYLNKTGERTILMHGIHTRPEVLALVDVQSAGNVLIVQG